MEPTMSQKDRPTSDVVFEHGHTLPGNVLKALHLVSLDDKRKAFQPTLMNQDGRVREIWFPGAHSDVGGGYNFDGLSDNALRYLLDWFEDQQELGITFKSSRSVQYGAPGYLSGRNHQRLRGLLGTQAEVQEPTAYSGWGGLGSRRCQIGICERWRHRPGGAFSQGDEG
jgi:hypothetical protein